MALFSVLIIRLFNLQIVNENYYMSTYIQKAEKTVYTSGTRGNIYDCKGRLLAYDTLAYVATIEDVTEESDDKNKQLNDIAEKTIKTIEKYGDKIIVDFPIILDENKNWKYNFNSDDEKNLFIKNLFGEDTVRDNIDLANATAPEMLYYLKDKLFEMKDYDNSMLLKMLSIRYNVYLNSYQKYVPVTIAENISKETMVAINENEHDIPGVKVSEKNIRRYNDAEYYAPILGYTGTISDEEIEKYNKKGENYVSSDVVGKAGIEAAEETELQGERGKEKIFVDSTGEVLSTISKEESSAGNDVYLSIDSKYQKAAYKLLEKKIASILLSEIVNHPVKERDEDDNSDDIHLIPATKVYSQLLMNNVVHVPVITSKSSENEKKFARQYKQYLNKELKDLENYLRDDNGKKYSSLNEEYKDYSDYIYDLLCNNAIVMTSSIDTEDSTYQAFVAGDISTQKFLKYAIKNNWINLEALKITDKYLSADETFDVLINYIIDTFKKDPTFGKKVVQYRVQDNSINGCELCMLLYDQKVFKMDKSVYNSLKSYDSYVAYRFIIDKIKKLEITPAQIALDPCSGSIVMTDPNNGKVKVLVTYPSYDNNNLSGTVDPDYWAKLVDDKSDPLYNRATQGVTAPGSTFKMCTAISALEENAVGVYETINAKGKFKKITPSPKCWIYPKSVHGQIDVVGAISESCNYFFNEMGYRLGTKKGKYDSAYGLKRIEKYATEIGLNMKSGVEITETDPHFSTESAVHSAIGQGSNAYAPVQLARYVSTIANGGDNYKLTLVDRIASTNGKTVEQKKPKISNHIDLKSSTWGAIHSGMRKVVTEGTVKDYFDDTKIKISGKSGTAEENKKRNPHGLFVAYAPSDKPEITCSAVIPFGNSSHDAAELAKNAIQYYYGEMKNKDLNKTVKKQRSSGVQD